MEVLQKSAEGCRIRVICDGAAEYGVYAECNGKQWQSAEDSEAVQGSEGVECLEWAGCEERRGWQRAAIEARRSLQNTVSNAEYAEYEEYMEDRTGLRRAAEDRGGPRRTAEDRGGRGGQQKMWRNVEKCRETRSMRRARRTAEDHGGRGGR